MSAHSFLVVLIGQIDPNSAKPIFAFDGSRNADFSCARPLAVKPYYVSNRQHTLFGNTFSKLLCCRSQDWQMIPPEAYWPKILSNERP